MSEVSSAIKQLISTNGIEQFKGIDQIGDRIDAVSNISILEKNLLKRCAFYNLFPETIIENESAANHIAQSIATALIKSHGIDEKAAQRIAVDICMGFSQDTIHISIFEKPSVQNNQSSTPHGEGRKEEKAKKKGFFSFFKRG